MQEHFLKDDLVRVYKINTCKLNVECLKCLWYVYHLRNVKLCIVFTDSFNGNRLNEYCQINLILPETI